MNDQPRFDESRSAAIRSMLVSTVADAPRRDHKRHLRIAVISVIAALAAGIGSAGVAVALTGTDLFGAPAPAPAVTETVTAAPPPVETPKPTAPAPTATPHPLVVTGDPITPHDVLTQPSTTPKWSLELPGTNDVCDYPHVLNVSDGYVLVQRGPTIPPEDSAYDCDLSTSRFVLSLVDTTTGTLVWSRDWTWDFSYTSLTRATLLGTSGRVMVTGDLSDSGPHEVLDLATGATLASIAPPAGFDVSELDPVPGDSGDVSFVVQKLDDAGQPTTSWAAMRADPGDLGSPRWSVGFEAGSASAYPILNDSSILQVYRTPVSGAGGVLDVLDVDSGATMAAATTDRSYQYYDGFTLRYSTRLPNNSYRDVAGIDDAGNQIWIKSLDTGYNAIPVESVSVAPEGLTAPVTEVLLVGPGLQMTLVDGVTGNAIWSADASRCSSYVTASGTVLTGSFLRTADGVIVQYKDDGAACGFDASTGAMIDVSTWASRYPGFTGEKAVYRLDGGMGTGGLMSEKGQPLLDPATAPPGTATALDATTGATLWTLPIAYDERWRFAGGYLVGFSQGKMFGIG